MNKIIVIGAVLFLFVSQVVNAKSPVPQVVTDLVKSAKSQINTIDMHIFKNLYDRKKNLNIIDVREPNEYEAGHIPLAKNIPRGVIEFKIWPLIGYPEMMDLNKRFYLYCKTGGRCSLAAKSLKDLGFKNVTAVDMKFADWQAAGYPVTKETLP